MEDISRQVPQIGGLEEQVYALYRQRAQKMVQRRRQDVRDQNDEFSPFAGMCVSLSVEKALLLSVAHQTRPVLQCSYQHFSYDVFLYLYYQPPD